MYDYSQPGGKIGKRLRVMRTLESGDPQDPPSSWTWIPLSFDLNSTYNYDNEGRMTSIQYPLSGPNLGWAYDTMGRLNTMTDLGAGTTIMSGATYGPSNQLLTLSGSVNETRTYNSMVQLTGLTVSGGSPSVQLTYNYSSTQNNGKIISQTDAISGETVGISKLSRCRAGAEGIVGRLQNDRRHHARGEGGPDRSRPALSLAQAI